MRSRVLGRDYFCPFFVLLSFYVIILNSVCFTAPVAFGVSTFTHNLALLFLTTTFHGWNRHQERCFTDPWSLGLCYEVQSDKIWEPLLEGKSKFLTCIGGGRRTTDVVRDHTTVDRIPISCHIPIIARNNRHPVSSKVGCDQHAVDNAIGRLVTAVRWFYVSPCLRSWCRYPQRHMVSRLHHWQRVLNVRYNWQNDASSVHVGVGRA